MTAAPYDVIGIGAGPFNLGLACLTQPIAGFRALFLERSAEFNWHPGMLLENATLQTPFLCDLVTLADPTSQFSFLNYLKQQGRIYSFYSFLLVTDNFFLLRNEFNAYCRWAAGRLDNVLFGREVDRVGYDAASGLYEVTCRNIRTGQRTVHRSRRLVLPSGMTPAMPDFCEPFRDSIVHTSAYAGNAKALRRRKSITIVGGGQSAAEVYYDLLKDIDRHGYRLDWLTRSPRFFPMELTKLTLQMTSPDYADYFHSLPAGKRGELVETMKDVYQGINATLINDIFDLIYRKRFVCDLETTLMANAELRGCARDEASGTFKLELWQSEQEERFDLETEALVLATGYRFKTPDFLEGVADRINWRDGGRFAVARDFSIDRAGGEIFTQNAPLHADAFAPPDLGQACYRNACIIRRMLGREVYPIERSVAFQTFPAPAQRRVEPTQAVA